MPRKFLLDVGHDGAGFAGAGLADRTSSRAGTGVPDRRPSFPTPLPTRGKGRCPLPDFFSGATGIPGRFREGLLLRGLHPPDHVGGPLLTSGRVGITVSLRGVRVLPRLEVTLTWGALASGALALGALRQLQTSGASLRSRPRSISGEGGGDPNYEFSMGAKWLDLLRQVAPNVSRIAVMFNPDTSPQSKLFLQSIQAAAPPFGMGVTTSSVHNTAEIEQNVESLSRDPNGGLLLPTDTFTRLHGKLIVELCARYRLPAISAHPEFVRDGGLIHYGIDGVEAYRQAALYVDRILKGTKPGDLPIQQPTKFILAINLKTARALGLDVPLRLQQIADEVIE